MWVIGVIFKKMEASENLNVDLTIDIQSFTDTGIKSPHSTQDVEFENDICHVFCICI